MCPVAIQRAQDRFQYILPSPVGAPLAGDGRRYPEENREGERSAPEQLELNKVRCSTHVDCASAIQTLQTFEHLADGLQAWLILAPMQCSL